jgi:hypothetical protein
MSTVKLGGIIMVKKREKKLVYLMKSMLFFGEDARVLKESFNQKSQKIDLYRMTMSELQPILGFTGMSKKELERNFEVFYFQTNPPSKQQLNVRMKDLVDLSREGYIQTTQLQKRATLSVWY